MTTGLFGEIPDQPPHQCENCGAVASDDKNFPVAINPCDAFGQWGDASDLCAYCGHSLDCHYKNELPF